MRSIEDEVLKKVRDRLNCEVLIKSEIDNPYLEKYIDILIEVVIREVFAALKAEEDRKNKEIARSLRERGLRL